MAGSQFAETGTFEEISPAAVLAASLAMGYYGCLTLWGAHDRYMVYLTGGALAGADEPLNEVLCAALALETGRYELSSTLPDAFSIHEPWRALQTAALGILGKARLKNFATKLRCARIEALSSPLQAWAAGIPEAAATLAQVCGRPFADVIREQPRLRTFVNLVLLREIGLVAWNEAEPFMGARPLRWREPETQPYEAAASYEAVEISDAETPPPADASEAVGVEIEVEITLDPAWPEAAAATSPEFADSAPVLAAAEEAPPAAPANEPAYAFEAPPALESAAGSAPAGEAPVHQTAPPEAMGALLDGSAFQEGLTFLRQGSLGAAKYRFEDHLRYHADDAEAAAYVTWIDLQEDLRDPAARRAALGALDLALARKRTADLLAFKGSVLRIEAKLNESLVCLEEALRVDPRHANARYERDQVRLRLGNDEWPDVNVEDIRVDAAIIVQRRIGNQMRVYSFKQTEIRVGSSENDDVVVSEAVLPQVARRHCTVTSRERRIWVRRNASLGRVFVNNREIDIRKDVPIGADDVVRLGDGLPALEFKAFGVNHLHDMSVLATGGIR